MGVLGGGIGRGNPHTWMGRAREGEAGSYHPLRDEEGRKTGMEAKLKSSSRNDDSRDQLLRGKLSPREELREGGKIDPSLEIGKGEKAAL